MKHALAAIVAAFGLVNLTDVPWIDSLPVCHVEDCSDQPGQVGVWTNREGNTYIELGEGITVLVIDNTVTK